MLIGGTPEKFQLDLAQGVAATSIGEEAIVVLHHQVFGALIADLPEANQLGFSTSEGEGAAQSVDAFPICHISHSGFAGGEDDQLGATQVEVAGFQGSENAIFAAAFARVESGQGEASPQEGVFCAAGTGGRTEPRFDFYYHVGADRKPWPPMTWSQGRQIGQKEAVGGDVENVGRLHLLEGVFGGLGAGQQDDAGEFGGKGGGFGGGTGEGTKLQLFQVRGATGGEEGVWVETRFIASVNDGGEGGEEGEREAESAMELERCN